MLGNLSVSASRTLNSGVEEVGGELCAQSGGGPRERAEVADFGGEISSLSSANEQICFV